jgi:putative alpha-1,2-mannosidase
LYPEKYSDMLASIGELYKQGKPQWATDTEPYITIRTEHSIAILLDAHRKGMLPFSLDEIYPHLKVEADSLSFESPDNVLESSYDLWALSEIAKDLGYEEDAQEYFAKAMNYQPLWKDKFLHMGENADVMHGDGLYEGTLWQYRWFVPFDIAGIQELIGGKDTFESQLDYFFENELFNIGNQPDIQVPYLYAYTNSPWKTQKVVNSLMNEETNNWYGTHKKWEKPLTRRIFQDSPEGYIKEMDDDAGTMSAWYVWSAMGFYPVFPGSTDLVITKPQFDKMTIKLPKESLVIETIKTSESAIFIQKVEIDGEEFNSCFINFNQLVKGGTIKIELGETPNKNWGVN